MISAVIKDELDRVLPSGRSVGLRIEKDVPLKYCHSLLRSPCLAVFFTVVDSAQGLRAWYKLAEQEVAKLIQEKGARYFPRDKHLVLIVPPDVSWDLSEVEIIKADAHICRKLVCLVNGQPLSHQLENLPFWPAEILEAPAFSLPGFDVLRALSTEGFDGVLIQDVYRHTPGVERMVQNILLEKYSVDVSPTTSASPDMSHVDTTHSIRAVPKAVSEQPRRLTQVEIQNFRGIRSLSINLSANIIFVYGTNGSGKTSIIDGLEWVVTGKINRLTQPWPDDEKRQPDPIVNLFSDTGHASVALRLSLDSQGRRIIRHGNLFQSKLRQIDEQQNVTDRDIIDEVVGTSAPGEERKLHIDHLRELLRSSHFLGQSTMREFLERTKPNERFDSLSKMLGAEAFVFFRRKVDQIIEGLSSYLNSSRFDAEEATRVVQARQAEIDEEEKEFTAVSTAMRESESALARATQIRNRLAIQGFPLPDEQIRIASLSLSGGDVEAIAILADEQIKTGVLQLERRLSELRIAADNLRQQTHLDNLAARATDEIAKAGLELEGLEKQRDVLEHKLGDYRALLEQRNQLLTHTREELRQNQWLSRNVPLWKRLFSEHKNLTEKIGPLTATKDAKQEEYGKLQSDSRILEDRREQLDRARSEVTQKVQTIRSLVNQLPQFQYNLKRLDEIGRLADFANQELSDCNSKLQVLERQRQEQSESLASVQGQFSMLEQSMTRKAALLEDLRQYIDSSVCPLCGHDHASIDTLLSRVSSNVGASSPELTRLQESRQTVEREIIESDRQTQTMSSTIGQLQARIRTLTEEQNRLSSDVRTFRQNVIALGFSWPEEPPVTFDRIERFLSDFEQTLSSGEIEQQHQDASTQLLLYGRHLVTCKSELNDLTTTLDGERKQLTRIQKDLEALERDGRNWSIFLRESLNEDEIQRLFQEQNQIATTYEKEIADIQLHVSGLEKDIASIANEVSLKRSMVADQKASIEQALRTRSLVKTDLARLGLAAEITDSDLQQEIRRTEDGLRDLDDILKDIERLNASLQMENLRKKITILKKELGDARAEAARKKASADKIEAWINCLTRLRIAVQKRHADSVEDRLCTLEPVINLLYNRLSTHPFLTKVNLQIADRDNHQTVRFALEANESVSIVTAPSRENRFSPGKFFSEAQINVLALSIFLAGAIQQRWSNLRTICVDDPVQQMDDMNAYACLELIRGLAKDRQFIITTCDPRFYQLAREMFECLNDNGQAGFCAYRLTYDGKEKHSLITDSPAR